MEGYGARLLSKMGWKPGTGLGAHRDGAITPVTLEKVKKNCGIGAKRARKANDMWWLHAYEDALRRQKNARDGKKGERAMQHTYSESDECGNETEDDANIWGENLLLRCEGRRCRPHGRSKLQRLKQQDQEVLDRTESSSTKDGKMDTRELKRLKRKQKLLKKPKGRSGKIRKTKKRS